VQPTLQGLHDIAQNGFPLLDLLNVDADAPCPCQRKGRDRSGVSEVELGVLGVLSLKLEATRS
jgi:hypothetical protein